MKVATPDSIINFAREGPKERRMFKVGGSCADVLGAYTGELCGCALRSLMVSNGR